MRRQIHELKPGETVTIGDSRVTLEAKSGQRARLRIESNEPIVKGRREPMAARPFASSSTPAEPQQAAAVPIVPRPRLAPA